MAIAQGMCEMPRAYNPPYRKMIFAIVTSKINVHLCSRNYPTLLLSCVHLDFRLQMKRPTFKSSGIPSEEQPPFKYEVLKVFATDLCNCHTQTCWVAPFLFFWHDRTCHRLRRLRPFIHPWPQDWSSQGLWHADGEKAIGFVKSLISRRKDIS